jgi:hypothetical protein
MCGLEMDQPQQLDHALLIGELVAVCNPRQVNLNVKMGFHGYNFAVVVA